MRSALSVLLVALVPAGGCRKDASPSPTADAGRPTAAPVLPGTSSADGVPAYVFSDPAWQEVQSAARSALPPGSSSLLEQALDRLAPFEPALRERLRERKQYDDGTPFEAVPEPARQAIDDLCAWQRAGGGLDTTSCEATRVLPTLTLARLALELSSGAPEHPALRAALYLSQRLREEGTTLLQVMLGVSVMLDAVERWKTLPPDARPVFAAYPPSDGFLLRAVAAEGVCVVRNAERILGPEGDDLRRKLAVEYGLPTEAELAEFLDRELGDLYRHFLSQVRVLRDASADPSAAFPRLDELAEALRRDPKLHPVISTFASPIGRRLQEMSEARDAYREYLQGGS
jgi:hypothetical protein